MSRAHDSWPVTIGPALCLVALTLAVYAQVYSHAFVRFDDDLLIFENPHLAQGLSWAGLRWALTTDYAGNWMPLTWLSLVADHALHGLSPRGYLLENVAWHGAASVLLWRALVHLTRARRPSFVIAAVFAVHPLHVESVAWAAQRKDVLSGFFFALLLLAYARTCERPGGARRALTAAAFAAGLLAKPTLVTAPFVLLLLDYWPLGRLSHPDRASSGIDLARLSAAVVEKLPLFALAVLTSVFTFRAQQAWGATVPLDRLPLATRAANAVVTYGAYARQALWPSGLAALYPEPSVGPAATEVTAAALFLVIVTAFAARAWRRRPYAIVGWLWYLGMLVPMIGLVQVGSQARADRYTYLPLIGLSIVVVFGVKDLAARWRPLHRALPMLAAAALAALAALSFRQVRFWRDSIPLFEHALAVTRENPVIHAQFGQVLVERGRFADGANHFREAVAIRPDYLEAVNNLAWLLATRPDIARVDPLEALRLALSAAQLTGFDNAAVLDTLAVSQASVGGTQVAAQTAEHAAELARAHGQARLAAGIETRLALFRAGQAYTEGEAR